MKKLNVFSALLISLFVFTSCNNNGSDIDPSLTTGVIESLKSTIADEYKAQVTYDRVLNDFGANLKPFVNIKKAEVKHAEAIASLMSKYGLDIPTNEFKIADIPVFQTVQEACATGVVAEVENIELYDSYLALDLPADIRNVFESNRAASLNNHLPAFQNCSE